MPSVEEMYPSGYLTYVRWRKSRSSGGENSGDALSRSDDRCGKLLHIAKPHVAVWSKKTPATGCNQKNGQGPDFDLHILVGPICASRMDLHEFKNIYLSHHSAPRAPSCTVRSKRPNG